MKSSGHKCSNIVEYNAAFLKDIQSICNPLFQNLPITHFIYKRVFQDGYYFLVSSDFDVTQKFMVSMKSSEDILFEDAWPAREEIQKYIWPQKQHEYIASGLEILRCFGISHGLNIVRRREEDKSIENIIFATSFSDVDIHNFFLNNFEIFNRFIFYFKNKAHKIIENPTTKKLAYSNFYHLKMQKLQLERSQVRDVRKILFDSFIEQTKITKFILKVGYAQDVTLSKMQIQCLYQLSRGKTAKEIARCFGISPRTVQTHLNFVKEKLDVSSKACILKYLSEDIVDFLKMEI